MNFELLVEQTMEKHDAQGLIAVGFNADGTILYEKTWGYADTEKQTPINLETLFGVASMTKSFTVIAIMQLVEAGVLDLETLVHAYIPELQGEQQEQITVAQLLYHAGGFKMQHRVTVYETLKKLGLMKETDTTYTEELATDETLALTGFASIIDILNNVSEFTGKPGEVLCYSNESYGLLTELVRRYGGAPSYVDYIQTHILQPLNMDRSSFNFLSVAQDANVTTLYRKAEDAETFEGLMATNDFYDTAYTLMGGGALKSTINDLIKYVTMFLHLGKTPQKTQILASESITAMMQPRIDFRDGTLYGYGLSIESVDGETFIGHGGSLTGVSSHMLWSMEQQKGVLILCNTTLVPVYELAKALLTEII